MEGLTSLVAESLARHGINRPLDYRRLQWSRWFRCESPHSLLLVPSKAGVFALAEEILAPGEASTSGKRMLAVLRFCEAEDMAFVLDRMFAPAHPMRSRLVAGHCFVRFVLIEDAAQRLTFCSALNQWMISSADKVRGTTGDFTSSLEFAPAAPASPEFSAAVPASLEFAPAMPAPAPPAHAVQLDSGSATNMHCPSPLPSGF